MRVCSGQSVTHTPTLLLIPVLSRAKPCYGQIAEGSVIHHNNYIISSYTWGKRAVSDETAASCCDLQRCLTSATKDNTNNCWYRQAPNICTITLLKLHPIWGRANSRKIIFSYWAPINTHLKDPFTLLKTLFIHGTMPSPSTKLSTSDATLA